MSEALITNSTEVEFKSPEKMDGRITTRNAAIEDIPELVDVDIKSFSKVYVGYEKTEDELREELTEKFTNRFELVGGKWIKVAERDGKIVGFIMSCPTSKDPMTFTSWEESTDNGTLNSTYDPEGENLYIVSLSVLRAGSVDLAQNMLFGNLLSEFVKENMNIAYFESRLPGLKVWVLKQCRVNKLDFNSLTKDQLDTYANEYFHLTKEKDGKEVPYDRLLEIYDSAGCKFVDVYADAYQDEPSLNYGVLGVFENPMPEKVRNSKTVRKLASFVMKQAAKSNYLMEKYW
jgi:hypothetical protein